MDDDRNGKIDVKYDDYLHEWYNINDKDGKHT